MTRIRSERPRLAEMDPKLDVLALPGVTTMRFVVLIAAMLTTGLFLGVTVFAAVRNLVFSDAAMGCLSSTRPLFQCAVGESEYALYAAGGALTIGVGAVVLVVVAPTLVIRRRGLRQPALGLAGAVTRIVALAADAGLRRPPNVLVGPLDLRDAFCFGRPGRYYVALPKFLALRSVTTDFETVLRHELAHIRLRDVALAWLARSIWYMLAPLLLVPMIVFPLVGDLDLLPQYVWRVVLLALVVEAAARSALRSREHTADLSAARCVGTAAVVSALSAVPRPPASTWWRRARAVHPSPSDRVSVVEQPGLAAAVTPVDGAVVAFLVLLSLPVLDAFFVAVLVVDTTGLAVVVAAVVVGALGGAALGPGLWRQAVAARVTGTSGSRGSVLAAVAAGGIAGQLVSPAGVGLSGVTGVSHPAVILVTAGALTAATAVVSGAGEIWADAAGRVQRPSSYIALAVVTSVVVFATALWAGDVLQSLLDIDGWAAAGLSVFAMLTATPIAVADVILALSAALGLVLARNEVRAPDWLSTSGCFRSASAPRLSQTVAAGVAAGSAAAVVMIVYRLLLGQSTGPAETLQRFYADLWMAGCAGAAAAAAAALVCGRRGWGAGLFAGAVAVLCAAAGHVGILTALNGILPVVVPLGVAANDLALGLLLTLATAALLPTSSAPRPTRSTAVLVGTSVLLAVALSTAVALVRDILIPAGLGPVP